LPLLQTQNNATIGYHC